jgi:hypothetical protein
LNLLHAFDQNDVAANETPTAGYNLLRAEISYTQEALQRAAPAGHVISPSASSATTC